MAVVRYDHTQIYCSPSHLRNSVTRKKLPTVYKSCPKMISLEK